MKAASMAWRLSLAALLLMATWQVWQLRRAPAWMQAQIEREGRQTRQAALSAALRCFHGWSLHSDAASARV